MELLHATDEDVVRAGKALAAGLLVVIPTETVYGLGANALDPRAVARVFEAKARPSFDPLIVHLADLDRLDEVASFPNEMAKLLAETLWPGPLTLILPKRERIPGLVTSGLSTVAVRLPVHPLARAVIRAAGIPVAAPSANPFGYLSPTRAEHVARMLGERVDFILDGGPCPVGVESTILDVTGSRPRLLRPGGMPLGEIEALVGKVELPIRTATRPTSPGQLPSHYAPRTPLHLLPRGGVGAADPGVGAVALLFDRDSRTLLGAHASRFSAIRLLSPAGDLREAAANLFETLHELDEAGYEEIWAERAPDEGLGLAVNDRLYRASVKD